MRNCRTTIAGVGTIAGAIASICIALTTTPIDSSQMSGSFAGIVAGIGLLLAKDFNVQR